MNFTISMALFFFLMPIGRASAPSEDPGLKTQLPGFVYELNKAKPMNGIAPGEYGDFWNKWPLVNVRFRKDNEEQRFVYGNDIAFKALKAGVKEYPEGAIFAKVAFAVLPDPSFSNSLQPHHVMRVQYMKKNGIKNSTTGNWSYALYVPNSKAGNVRDGVEDITDQQVCHGCHTLAKTKDFVFSKYAFSLTGFNLKDSFHDEEMFKTKFKLEKVSKLSPYGQKILGNLNDKATFNMVNVYNLPLFLGGLHESIGPLNEFVTEDHAPYLLIDDQRKEFLLIYPGKSNKDCPHLNRIIMPLFDRVLKKRVWHVGNICEGKNNWLGAIPVPPEVAAWENNEGWH